MSSYEGSTLPDEILSMICQELGQDRDFGSLYRCALSCKSFADPALRTMYQWVYPLPRVKPESAWN